MQNWSVLLCAPPASGKTYFLRELIKTQKLIYIAPLRAICEEMFQVYSGLGHKVKLNEQYNKNFDIHIYTVEQFHKLDLDLIRDCLIVLDECHLVYHWRVFRYLLDEVYYGILSSRVPVIFLSATLTGHERSQLSRDSQWSGREFIYIDNGNFKLRYVPHSQFCLGKHHFFLELLNSIKTRKNIFIFCKYRYEVSMWKNVLHRWDKHILTCLGGESKQFIEELHQNQEEFKIIISTQVLSHGVNLPIIKNVFLTTPPSSKSMFIQVLARGGRDGGGFKLFYKKSWLSPKNLILSMCRYFILILKHSSNMNTWKSWKELSSKKQYLKKKI